MVQLLIARPARVAWIAAAIGLTTALVYALTAEWGSEQNGDAVAAALAAWSLADSGSIAVPDFARDALWIIETEIGHVSNRPPGVWAPAVIPYLLASLFESGFSYWPATFTAVAITSAYIAVMFLVLQRLADTTPAIVGSAVLAFGSANWPVSSAQLWPHGTVQLLLAMTLLHLSSSSEARAGIPTGLAILVRPVTAIIPAVMGAYLALSRRSPLPLLSLGVPASLGAAALAAYNRFAFGRWSLVGGYSLEFSDRLVDVDASGWASNYVGMFIDPGNGVLWWTPVLLVLIPAIWSGWKHSPDWVKASAIASLFYLALHAKLNRISGGMPFNYRYQLPCLTLAAPLLIISATTWMQGNRFRRALLYGTSVLSISVQLLYVVAFSCEPVTEYSYACGFSF